MKCRRPLLLLFAASVAGCATEHVGNKCSPEDRARATEVVWRRDGLPAYAGQALVITSCGVGFCHSVEAVGAARYGVARGYDFDPQLIDQAPYGIDGARRLRSSQLTIFDQRDEMYTTVVNGTMPPGEIGAQVQQAPYVRFDSSGVRSDLPGLATAEGRETFRNWLACGAPVVERTAGLGTDTACSADGDCLFTGRCNLGARSCVPVGVLEPYRSVAVDPTWSSIYDVLIETRCASNACHGSRHEGDLDLSEESVARENLVDREVSHTLSAADDSRCPPMERYRVEPGNPDGSFLYNKIEQTESSLVCGDVMPDTGRQLEPRHRDAIRAWIMAGAMP